MIAAIDWGHVASAAQDLPEYLGGHIELTLAALVSGLIITAPLTLAALRIGFIRGPLLAIASIVQTIPSLALLALMVPLLSRIGFLPAAIALTAYSILPIFRNAVTGIEGVEPAVVEAARGCGMTERQVLLKVQLPLAASVIIAGVRTATVWVVGIATLSTPVGAASLGNYIFTGLQLQRYEVVVFGCVVAAALALALDGLIRLGEIAANRRSKGLGAVALAGVLIILIGGLVPKQVVRMANAGPATGPNGESMNIVIGAKTFTEQYILAEAMEIRLEEAGFRARTLGSMGSTIIFDSLANGKIDAYIDYSGTIWANHMQRTQVPDAQTVLLEVGAWLQQRHGVFNLGALGFENAYALAVRRETAEEYGLETIADLADHAGELAIGGDYEFFDRPEWEAVRSAYGLRFRERRKVDSTLMYSAVATGQVDVVSAFSTDGRIIEYDLVVLEDPKSALPPYDAMILLSESMAGRDDVRAALEGFVGAIPIDIMRRANKMVDVDDQSVDDAAKFILESTGAEEKPQPEIGGPEPPAGRAVEKPPYSG